MQEVHFTKDFDSLRYGVDYKDTVTGVEFRVTSGPDFYILDKADAEKFVKAHKAYFRKRFDRDLGIDLSSYCHA